MKSLSKEGLKPAAPRSSAGGRAARKSTGNGSQVLPPIPVGAISRKCLRGVGCWRLRSELPSSRELQATTAHAVSEGEALPSAGLGEGGATPPFLPPSSPTPASPGLGSVLHTGLVGFVFPHTDTQTQRQTYTHINEYRRR